MNKLSLALALGTGLALGALAPAARASTLTTANMSAAEFNTLFKPTTAAPALNSDVTFDGVSGSSGTLRSQVFVGGKDATTGVDATGLYAYAYQISVNNPTGNAGEPPQVQNASWLFNATPAKSQLAGSAPDYAYTITNGSVGGLAAPSGGAAVPTALSWVPGSKVGSLTASYFDSTKGTPALTPGETSATFVVLSSQPPSADFQHAGVLGLTSQTSKPDVYSPSAGDISPIPIPEPATVLAWAGMAGAVVLVRRTRKTRLA